MFIIIIELFQIIYRVNRKKNTFNCKLEKKERNIIINKLISIYYCISYSQWSFNVLRIILVWLIKQLAALNTSSDLKN